MNRRVVVLLSILASAQVAAATASLRLDRQRIAVGETVELSVTVDGAQDVPAPAIPAPDGLRIDYRGQSTSVSIENGRMSASATHGYAVTALRPGAYAIGPVRIEHQGRIMDAGVARLVVIAGRGDAQAGPGDDELRLVANVSARRAYLHQPLTLTVRLEVRGVRVADLQYPTVAADGFTMAGFPEPAQRRERGPAGIVDVVEFTTEVVPVRSGTRTLGPATLQLSRVLAGRSDAFFGSLFGRRQPATLTSQPVEIEVLPLPVAGRPASFSGAVGRFTIAVTAGPTEVDEGDPVTIGITVSGTGTLGQATPPRVPAASGLKLYEPAEPDAATRSGAVVTRRFEQVVIPERAGAVTIPAIEFGYFDPAAERYVTARGPDIPVTVRPRAAATRPDVVVGAPMPARARPVEELGRDIVFIKDEPGALVPIGSVAPRSIAFWAAQLVPLLALAAVVAWDRRRARLGGDPRLGRFAGAGAAARRALAAARQAGEADAAARAYTDYLAAKLDLAPGAVTPDVVRARLTAVGIGDAVVEESVALLAAFEHERYRPEGGDGGALHARAERVVAALERERRIVLPLVLLAVLTAGTLARAADTPKTLFFRGNALYADGRFAEAAAAWEEILATGLESGPLHYNVGNAYLRAGDRGRAVVAYERAWRLMPGDPDLATNLRFAEEEATPTEGMSLAGRIAFPLAERMATSRLVWGALLAWWALAGALIAGRLAPRAGRGARVVALAAGVALVVTASAAAYRYLRVDAPAWAAVLADAEVRFEPASTGTVHYEAPLGTVVEVLAERDGWAQVARRSDGLRGWVPRERIEALRVRAEDA